MEMGDIGAPFQSSPPWLQLAVLVTVNTALYVLNAFLVKFFNVDVLSILGMMTGASPLDPNPHPSAVSQPSTTAVPKTNAAADAFRAFAQNF